MEFLNPFTLQLLHSEFGSDWLTDMLANSGEDAWRLDFYYEQALLTSVI